MSSSAAEGRDAGEALRSARRLIAPLALAQFICSFAGSNMNVSIQPILVQDRTVIGGVPAGTGSLPTTFTFTNAQLTR